MTDKELAEKVRDAANSLRVVTQIAMRAGLQVDFKEDFLDMIRGDNKDTSDNCIRIWRNL